MKTANEPTLVREGGLGDPADGIWRDPESLIVNPVFQALIPLQSRGELLALETSIVAEGCHEPLLVWKGKNVVLDGHTRRELCIKHNRKVKVREVELPDEAAARDFILQIQRQRRNLTREALSYLRGIEYNAVKKQHGGKREAKGQSDPLLTVAGKMAEKFGVSEKTVKRDGVFAQVIDEIVADHGDPGIKRKLLSADLKLTQGMAAALHKMTAQERRAAMDLLVEKGRLPRVKRAANSGTMPKEAAQSLMARLQKKGEGHAQAVVKQLALLLGMEVVEKKEEG